MRIALVIEDLNDTGANRVSLDRAVRWQRGGDTVVLFVASAAVSKPVPVPSGLVPVYGAPGRDRLRSTLPLALWNLLHVARRSDVVVAGTEVGFGLLLARIAASLTRRPFAVTVQSRVDLAVEKYVQPRLRRPTRAALSSADLAVCVAQDLMRSTVASGVPAERVRAVRNAVPRADLQLAAAEDPALDWDRSVPVVVGVGRLTHQKGFDLLVRAHAQALAAGAPPHLVMVLGDGDDGERQALEHLILELGVQRTVRLAGFVTNPHAVVSRASLFALSSRWEGLPLCLVEALAYGTPCVAFDCVAGPSEILDNGRFGRLVPAGDVAALAAALIAHLSNPEELTAKARLAATEDLDIFDPERAATAHRDELVGLMARRRGRPDRPGQRGPRTFRAGGAA